MAADRNTSGETTNRKSLKEMTGYYNKSGRMYYNLGVHCMYF